MSEATDSRDSASQKGTSTSRAFALGLLGVVMMLILPVPAGALDVMLALSITTSLVVFLLAIHFGDPVDFSTFPSVLLVATTLRLSLNIASTRLILLNGHEGPDAAGSVIQTFGQFVVGGSYVVGIIVFLILVIINFKVITAGAGRISEVAARFTLDAMPGKQMAIDNDLANGHITEVEARKRRKKISDEADFYGAMDGANKFVKGDAVAGLIITAINIIAGIIIGVAQNGLSLADAAETYTILTVGDGLVSQIPALLVSTAAGLIASRTASGQDLGSSLIIQVLGRREPLLLAGVALVGLSLFPGMPTFSFMLLGGGCFYMARRAHQKQKEAELLASGAIPQAKAESADEEAPLHELMAVDLLALEVGFDLVPLVDKKRGGELLKRIGQIRRQLAQELGVVVPPCRVRDNLQLRPGEYRLVMSGTPIGGGELQNGRLLAIDPGGASRGLKGIQTKDPAFGMPALWIPTGDKDRAEILGYTVVDPATVAATHLTEMMRQNAAEFLGRLEAQELIDAFAINNAKLVEEVIPTLLPLGEVIKVLKNLLTEGISIRDMRTILEAVADHAGQTKDTDQLTELVRQRMSRALTARYSVDGDVHALVMDPSAENVFRARPAGPESAPSVDPTMLPQVINGLERAIGSLASVPSEPLLLTSPDVRANVANLAARHAPGPCSDELSRGRPPGNRQDRWRREARRLSSRTTKGDPPCNPRLSRPERSKRRSPWSAVSSGPTP